MIRTVEKILSPVRPNAGITAEYQRRLRNLVEDMARSYHRFIVAAYRANQPRMAMDDSPAAELLRALRKLGRRWQQRLDDAAPKLARWFAQSANNRSKEALKTILREGGISVQFTVGPRERDVLEAAIAENVSLIKSIGSEYHTKIEGLVMRSVQTGRDLEPLARDLRQQFGVTRRRANLIALDQNNKATAVLTRVRQVNLGIDEAIWLHSHAGKKPRPTHRANDGNRYNVREGWFDPDPKVRRRIWPGELIHCRCVSKPVVRGFS